MSGRGEWTRESEAQALASLQASAEGARPAVLVYTRQSVTDFGPDGVPRGPSLNQQLDAVVSRPELHGLPIEHYQDADRSGKETARRPGYLALIERIHTAPADAIGAVAFYDADRLHRNDLEFFRFMAEMTERRILVFDASGLVSNVDRLSWKVKAIVAQEEREKVARRVRDNLRYLRRSGHLLGLIPQGYRRVDGQVVEDPEAAAVIREIFRLYATGTHSFATLAEHLNRQGTRPPRGPDKARHNRPKAVIFTRDVLKDIVGNASYLGQVMVDGELVEGKHPALVDKATWRACQEVRQRNLRRTSRTWTRHSYPLTPLLCCARCGGPMHGEASAKRRRLDLYYACHHSRRSRSAVPPSAPTCDARWIPAGFLEAAIRTELGRCSPTAEAYAVYRDTLRRAVTKDRRAPDAAEVGVRRLEEQLERARRLYEFGEYDWETFVGKRTEIRGEQQRLREQAQAGEGRSDLQWCQAQLLDLLAAWDAGDGGQRTRLLAGLFDRIEAEAAPSGALRVVAAPKRAWKRFFEYVVLERETGFEPATSTLARLRSTE